MNFYEKCARIARATKAASVRGVVKALATAGLVAGFATGCGAIDPIEIETADVDQREEALWYASGALWQSRTISVCFKQSTGFANEKTWLKQVLKGQRSWEDSGRLVFTGFGTCVGDALGIRVEFGNSSYVPSQPSGDRRDVFLTGGNALSTGCPTFSPAVGNERCLKLLALHEFGHAVGNGHEQLRPDKPSNCTAASDPGQGDTAWGPFDLSSIMLTHGQNGVCTNQEDLSGLDRTGIARMYGMRDGGNSRLGDFNNDNRADLLCHFTSTGGKGIDLASSTGTYGTTDWTTQSNWCGHDTGKLYKGYFNNDSYTDLLCHDVVNGNIWLDYADSNGQFGGTDWSMSNGFCSQASGQLLIGDFNGDGIDDLMCHDIAIGFKLIDYGNTSGQYGATDWMTMAGWCAQPTERLYVGQFNGLGGDDLLCHDIVSGTKAIDYASSTGQFAGTNWSTASNWCGHASGELHIGDFNRDGKDDLLCHDTVNGSKWIDHASSTGSFNGTNWSSGANWCGGSLGRLFIGDVNGDDRDDLVCHNTRTGEKWVDYADSAGVFGSNDFYVNGSWCMTNSAFVR